MWNIGDALPLSGVNLQLHSLYASEVHRFNLTSILNFLCVCLYIFLSLVDIPDQCSPSPCYAGGTVRCEDKKGDFLCHCFTGWAGPRCDEGIVISVGKCVCVFIVAHSARAQQRLYLCTVTLRHMQHLWIDVRLFDLASDSQIMSRIMTGKSVFQSLIFVIELSNIVIMLMWMLFFILTLQNFTSSDPVLFSCNCNSCCSTCLFNNQLWLLLLLTMWQVNVNCMYGNSQP